MNLGELLKKKRLELGYIMKDVTDKMDIDVSNLSCWENNKNRPRADKLQQLIKILNIIPSELKDVEMEYIPPIKKQELYIDNIKESLERAQQEIKLFFNGNSKFETKMREKSVVVLSEMLINLRQLDIIDDIMTD